MTLLKTKKKDNIEKIDVNKISVSKKESYGIKIHLTTLLNKMIIMLLDHYI